MAQANELPAEHFVRLRQYKVDELYCRYYTEFCEFDTLEILRLRHKAWNRYLPERFLWHIFYRLAHGYLDFVRGPWRSLSNNTFGQVPLGQYLLHNDIKADNIFLGTNGSRPIDSAQGWYPVPKIGDFGLSMTTNPDEGVINTAQHIQRGTPPWKPPVRIVCEQWYIDRRLIENRNNALKL